jgi:hypothetical protein
MPPAGVAGPASGRRHITFHQRLRRAVARRIGPYTSRVEDMLADRAIRPKLERLRRSSFHANLPSLSILVVGVQSPRRPGSLDRIYEQMASDRHRMTFDSKGVEKLGKLDNVNVLLERHDLSRFDWVVMVDDDVELPDHFTDTFIALAEYAELKIAGPAQRAWSYWSHRITKRQHGVLVRQTNYAEIGPIIALRREVFDLTLPMPSLRFGWGVDMVWPVLAAKRGYKTGVVDGAALRHVSPIAADYDHMAAAAEAEAYMNPHGIVTGVHVLATSKTIRDIA